LLLDRECPRNQVVHSADRPDHRAADRRDVSVEPERAVDPPAQQRAPDDSAAQLRRQAGKADQVLPLLPRQPVFWFVRLHAAPARPGKGRPKREAASRALLRPFPSGRGILASAARTRQARRTRSLFLRAARDPALTRAAPRPTVCWGKSCEAFP